MLNRHESHIIERLKNPEREAERRKMTRNLFVRNILNAVFMLLALASMAGIVATAADSRMRTAFYLTGLAAVAVKMVEVMLRMPGFRK
ncbi:MAG: hypothetical protein J1F06_05650 [Prevotellaceae bacterium]|nr:hypothetical protein [Prevotellaceae bacterium]